MLKYTLNILGNMGAPAMHGISVLEDALLKCEFGRRVTVGTTKDSGISALLHERNITAPEGAESYRIIADDDIIIAGGGDAGLMYACLELAEDIGFGIMPTSRLGEPYLATRGIYELPHNRVLESERFYSKEYWIEYFNMLAQNRINSFNYVYSHQTSYHTPVFAYYINDDKYPNVHPTDIDADTIGKNREMLKFITELARDRGITFILGIWQVCPWFGNQNDWRPPQANNVAGITPDMLEDYTYRAAKQMLEDFPYIAGIQIRVNVESGITEDNQTAFFKNTIFKALAETGRLLDYRGWCALPETTQTAIEMCGDNMRASMKYWAEFMGAPYQPCKIVPGYSYGDLLANPMPYRFLWQVWSLGSPRLLLWGNPNYVRRLVETCRLGDAEGFEINPHLAQKGYGNDPDYWRIFKRAEDEYFTHEYERYWMFYLLFGRMAYNPALDESVWIRELSRRVGKNAAAPLMKAYELSSAVITFLIQFHLSDLNMYTWPEIDTGGLLEFYNQTPSSDPCTIYNICEYVQDCLNGTSSGKLTPMEASKMFADWSGEILIAADKAARSGAGKELKSAVIDFRIMAFLAKYHSVKIRAGLDLEFFYGTGDGDYLKSSYQKIREATVVWEQLVNVSQDMYYDEMVTGPLDSGSWKKKLRFVYEDELRIAELLGMHERYGNIYKGFDFGGVLAHPCREHGYFELVENFTVERGYIGVNADCVYNAEKGYGFISGAVQAKQMAQPRLSDKDTDEHFRRDALFGTFGIRADNLKSYRSPLYEDYIYGSDSAVFACDLPNGEYLLTLVFRDESPETSVHGPFSVSVSGKQAVTDKILLPLERCEVDMPVTITDGRLEIAFCGDWMIAAIILRDSAARINHTPVKPYKSEPNIQLKHNAVEEAACGQDLPLSITVSAENGIAAVNLCYSHMNQMRPLEKLTMTCIKDGCYESILPGAYLDARYNAMYYFEVIDTNGDGRIFPDFRQRTPYYIVRVR